MLLACYFAELTQIARLKLLDVLDLNFANFI